MNPSTQEEIGKVLQLNTDLLLLALSHQTGIEARLNMLFGILQEILLKLGMPKTESLALSLKMLDTHTAQIQALLEHALARLQNAGAPGEPGLGIKTIEGGLRINIKASRKIGFAHTGRIQELSRA